LRKATRLTQEQVAERAGVAPNFLGYIERGEKRPSLEVTFALAKALSVPAATLFHFEREETDPKLLRKKIDALLEKCSPQQLQQAHRLLKSLLEP
jgi:transcriptional regulator with XRE-family HTH domain